MRCIRTPRRTPMRKTRQRQGIFRGYSFLQFSFLHPFYFGKKESPTSRHSTATRERRQVWFSCVFREFRDTPPTFPLSFLIRTLPSVEEFHPVGPKLRSVLDIDTHSSDFADFTAGMEFHHSQRYIIIIFRCARFVIDATGFCFKYPTAPRDCRIL